MRKYVTARLSQVKSSIKRAREGMRHINDEPTEKDAREFTDAYNKRNRKNAKRLANR